MNDLEKILKYSEPYLVLLIGTPLVGKSTFLKNNFNRGGYTLISRDDIILEVAETSDYDEAWKILSDCEDEFKMVDKLLKSRLIELNSLKENVIIDMTNMSRNGRHKHIAKFPKHFKCAIIFDNLPMMEYELRNNDRIND